MLALLILNFALTCVLLYLVGIILIDNINSIKTVTRIHYDEFTANANRILDWMRYFQEQTKTDLETKQHIADALDELFKTQEDLCTLMGKVSELTEQRFSQVYEEHKLVREKIDKLQNYMQSVTDNKGSMKYHDGVPFDSIVE